MIAVISDLHVHNFRVFGGVKVSGINERCHQTLVSVSHAVSLANSKKCKALVVTGDLYDVSDPSPQIQAALIYQLQQFNGDVHVIAGNHDQFSTSEGDHALGPMSGHRTYGGKIYCWEETADPLWDADSPLVRTMFVPFRPEPVDEWLPALLKESVLGHENIFAHFGIIDDHTPIWLQQAPDAFSAAKLMKLMKKYKIKRFVVGNWHEHQTWTDGQHEIIQVGALTPTGFNNPGTKYGRVVLLGSKTQVAEIDGPRFFSMTWKEGHVEQRTLFNKNAYVRMEAEPGDLAAARTMLKGLRDKKAIRGFDLKPSKAQAQAQARSAARAAAQPIALRDAATAYVSKMMIDDGVSRENVLSRVQSYLKR